MLITSLIVLYLLIGLVFAIILDINGRTGNIYIREFELFLYTAAWPLYIMLGCGLLLFSWVAKLSDYIQSKYY